jgi:hypothetical protein
MRISKKNRSHLFASTPYKLALGLSVLLSFETEAQSFRQGFWNAQIKQKLFTLSSPDPECGWGGWTNGTDTVAELNSLNSLFYAEQLNPFTGTGTLGEKCFLKNLASVAAAWSSPCSSGRCSGLKPYVVGMIPVNKLEEAEDGSPIDEGADNMSTITPAPDVQLAVGVDDMHTALQDYGNSTVTTGYAYPNGVVEISEIETAYNAKDPNVKFFPYLEAGRALYYAGDSVRMGVKYSAQWTVSSNSPTGTSYAVQSTFNIPASTSQQTISFPVVDLYTVDRLYIDSAGVAVDERRHLFLSAESSTDGGANWTCVSYASSGVLGPVDLLNNGDSNVKLLKIDVFAPRSTDMKVRFTLNTGKKNSSSSSRGDGACNQADSSRIDYKVGGTNKPKMVVVGMPKLKLAPITPGITSAWFGDLLRSSPASYSVTPNIAVTDGFSEITPDANRLVNHSSSSSSRKYLDGLMFKLVEESSYDADLHALFLEAVCRIPQSYSPVLECLEVGWGNSLQMPNTGMTLNPVIEAQRFTTALGIANGYVSFNAPLAYRASTKGIYSKYPTGKTSSSSYVLKTSEMRIGSFLWPGATRMINGYYKKWTFTVPSGAPRNVTIKLVNIVEPNNCENSANNWSLSINGSLSGDHTPILIDPSSSYLSSFRLRRGEIITIESNPVTKPDINECGADIIIDWGAWGAFSRIPVTETVHEDPEVPIIMNCLESLFTGTSSSC